MTRFAARLRKLKSPPAFAGGLFCHGSDFSYECFFFSYSSASALFLWIVPCGCSGGE